LNFELIKQPVSNPTDVYPAAVAMFKKVDAIYTGIDHLMLENLESLMKASREASKPVFGGESGSVEKGAVMAITINMYDFGMITSEMIAKVLHGTNPGDIPIGVIREGELLINREAATKFNLDIEKAEEMDAKYYDSKTK